MRFQLILLIALLISCVTTLVTGHSHLGFPKPTRRLDCRVGNRRKACPGPCPALDTFGQPSGITASNPAATWRRGEHRTITWHRNNHGNGESGFVRLTLVPVSKMMDKSAHARYTFQISCWSAGLHWCSSRNVHECGNDAEGKAYGVKITVPTSYPDGVYVFGWAWYGGGDFRARSFFGDYYSCSFVRINGGTGPLAQYKPVFIAGKNQQHSDSCLSSVNRIGACPREPCHVGPIKRMKPVNLPKAIYASELGSKGSASQGQCNANGRTPDGKTCGQQKPNSRTPGSRITSLSFQMLGMMVLDVKTGRSHNVGYKFSIKQSKFPKGFTLALRTSGRIGHVKFNVGKWSHTENAAPYVINGNHAGRLYRFDVCRPGRTVNIYVTVAGIRNSKQFRFEMKCN